MSVRRILSRRDDKGQALVLVVVVSVLVLAFFGVALTTSTNNIKLSSQYAASTQATLAARAGIDTEIAAMSGDPNFANLPCYGSADPLVMPLSLPGATSSYSVQIQYHSGAASLACGTSSTLGSQTSLPTSATITSTGKAPHGSQTVMQASLNVVVPFPPALGYAIYSSGTADFPHGSPVVQSANPSSPPNIYSLGNLTCAHQLTVSNTGSITAGGSVSLTASCIVTGDVTANDSISLDHGATVSGYLYSYSGGITVAGGSTVSGNVTAGGPASTGTIANSATVSGHADASGTVTGTYGQGVTQNDGSLVGVTPPAAIPSRPSNRTRPCTRATASTPSPTAPTPAPSSSPAPPWATGSEPSSPTSPPRRSSTRRRASPQTRPTRKPTTPPWPATTRTGRPSSSTRT